MRKRYIFVLALIPLVCRVHFFVMLSPFGMVEGILQGSVDDLHVFLQLVEPLHLWSSSWLASWPMNSCCSIRRVRTVRNRASHIFSLIGTMPNRFLESSFVTWSHGVIPKLHQTIHISMKCRACSCFTNTGQHSVP